VTTSRAEAVDVIVVGCGSAAFATAIAAKQLGAARVLMLEKAPEEDFGGNPRWSHSGFRWVQNGADEVREFLPDLPEEEFRKAVIRPYRPEDMKGHLTRATRGRINPDLLNLIVDNSNAGIHWLKDIGLKWQLDLKLEIDGKFHFEPGYTIHPKGGGLGQLEQLRAIALGMGIEIRYDSKVSALRGHSRKIEGVSVVDPEGIYDLTAPNVILCSGGFQANPEMRARYLPPNADLMKVRGSRHNTGEVLQMALAMGAAASGQWSLGHSSVVSADSPAYSLIGKRYSRYSYTWGISVNTEGRRYCDEGENLRMMTYAKMGWKALAEPDGMAWQIFDSKVNNYEGNSLLRSGYRAGGESYEAQTISELADLIGVPAALLEHTVKEFNASIDDDAADFDPTRLDSRSTTGLIPPKSNWAVAIDTPPFLAYPVTAGVTFTFGGLHVNTDAQVLNVTGDPIEGLYASGDIMGIFYNGYVGSTGQTRNVVFSRQAAAHAMSR
jgi:tricarballylate dehydrogenase